MPGKADPSRFHPHVFVDCDACHRGDEKLWALVLRKGLQGRQCVLGDQHQASARLHMSTQGIGTISGHHAVATMALHVVNQDTILLACKTLTQGHRATRICEDVVSRQLRRRQTQLFGQFMGVSQDRLFQIEHALYSRDGIANAIHVTNRLHESCDFRPR